MRTLTTISMQLWHSGKSSLMSCAAVAGLMIGTLNPAAADCPWIVQPHVDGKQRISNQTLVNIVFDGMDHQEQFFYGFTVADIALAWHLSSDDILTDIGPHGRSLNMMETHVGPAFEVSADSIEPHTVYLVAATAPVGELEAMAASIEPSRPFTVSDARTRGATDVSGPLPTRSLPGIEIRSSSIRDEFEHQLRPNDRSLGDDRDQVDSLRGIETTLAVTNNDLALGLEDASSIWHDVQICAYQVAMR